MTIDRIPHNALHTQYSKEKETKADQDYDVNEDIESFGRTSRGAMDLTKDRGQWRSFIRTNRRQIAGVRN